MFHRKVHRFKPEDEELARDNPSLIEIIEEVSLFKQLNNKMITSFSRMLLWKRCQFEEEGCAKSSLKLTGGRAHRLAVVTETFDSLET